MSTPSTTFSVTDRNRVRRVPERGQYDKETVYAILDDAIVCHVGLIEDGVDGEGQPVVIPTLHARDGDTLLLHGATTSRLIQYVQAGNPVCVAVTHVDGIVLARSVFHHSINYRSVVLFGQGELVTGDAEKMDALRRFTERLMPGRWDDARQPNEVEFKATSVVAIPIDSASAKVRTGDPGDDPEDLALPVWAGVLPVTQQVSDPIPAPDMESSIPLPEYIRDYVEKRR